MRNLTEDDVCNELAAAALAFERLRSGVVLETTPKKKVRKPRAPARVTQADVARVIRAAKQAGACGIDVKLETGTISISLSTATKDKPIDVRGKVVL
jgi:hypothetical protein